MLKRWIIRVFFLALLLLCLGAWARSYRHGDVVSYSTGGRHGGCVVLNHGIVVLSSLKHSGPRAWWYEDNLDLDPPEDDIFHIGDGTILGFRYTGGGVRWADFEAELCVPLWFLSVVGAVVLFFAWRATRLPALSGAFPVDVTAPKVHP